MNAVRALTFKSEGPLNLQDQPEQADADHVACQNVERQSDGSLAVPRSC